MSALRTGLCRPGIIMYLAVVLLLVISSTYSAPVQETETTQIAEYDGGCYYNNQRYQEGARIITNEPCLNCTCHNRMLQCYLRVCPFTKAIGQDCMVEKRPDQCCPVITCPEVLVQLLTSTTSAPSKELPGSTDVGFPDTYGCNVDERFYADGAQMPFDPRNPCELCYCIRNKTTCLMQQCTLSVAGCKPVYQDGICCPVKYNCEYEDMDTTPGLIMTTTLAPREEPPQCDHEGKMYEDGELIYTIQPCQHCYCLHGKIACAVQECEKPMEFHGKNCTALPPLDSNCCPTYHCAPDNTTMEILEIFPGADNSIPEEIVGAEQPTSDGSLLESSSIGNEIPESIPTKSPEDISDSSTQRVDKDQPVQTEAPIEPIEDRSEAPIDTIPKTDNEISRPSPGSSELPSRSEEELVNKIAESSTESEAEMKQSTEADASVIHPEITTTSSAENEFTNAVVIDEVSETTKTPISESSIIDHGVDEFEKESFTLNTNMNKESEVSSESSSPGSLVTTPEANEIIESITTQDPYQTMEEERTTITPDIKISEIEEKPAPTLDQDNVMPTATEDALVIFEISSVRPRDDHTPFPISDSPTTVIFDDRNEEISATTPFASVEESHVGVTDKSIISESSEPSIIEGEDKILTIKEIETSSENPEETYESTESEFSTKPNVLDESKLEDSDLTNYTDRSVESEFITTPGSRDESSSSSTNDEVEELEIMTTLSPEIISSNEDDNSNVPNFTESSTLTPVDDKSGTYEQGSTGIPIPERVPEHKAEDNDAVIDEVTQSYLPMGSDSPQGVNNMQPETFETRSTTYLPPLNSSNEIDRQPSTPVYEDLPKEDSSTEFTTPVVITPKAPFEQPPFESSINSLVDSNTGMTEKPSDENAKEMTTLPSIENEIKETEEIPHEELPKHESTDDFDMTTPIVDTKVSEDEKEIMPPTSGEENTNVSVGDNAIVREPETSPKYDKTDEFSMVGPSSAMPEIVDPEIIESQTNDPNISETSEKSPEEIDVNIAPASVSTESSEQIVPDEAEEPQKLLEDLQPPITSIPLESSTEISNTPVEDDSKIEEPSVPISPESTQSPESMDKSEEESSHSQDTNEILTENQSSGIPGEGNCLVDGQSYINNSAIPPANPCQISCQCVSSIVKCEIIKCSPPPADLTNCSMLSDPNMCCPIYTCNSAPSVELQVNNQMSEQHTPKYEEDKSQPMEGLSVDDTTITPEIVSTQEHKASSDQSNIPDMEKESSTHMPEMEEKTPSPINEAENIPISTERAEINIRGDGLSSTLEPVSPTESNEDKNIVDIETSSKQYDTTEPQVELTESTTHLLIESPSSTESPIKTEQDSSSEEIKSEIERTTASGVSENNVDQAEQITVAFEEPIVTTFSSVSMDESTTAKRIDEIISEDEIKPSLDDKNIVSTSIPDETVEIVTKTSQDMGLENEITTPASGSLPDEVLQNESTPLPETLKPEIPSNSMEEKSPEREETPTDATIMRDETSTASGLDNTSAYSTSRFEEESSSVAYTTSDEVLKGSSEASIIPSDESSKAPEIEETSTHTSSTIDETIANKDLSEVVPGFSSETPKEEESTETSKIAEEVEKTSEETFTVTPNSETTDSAVNPTEPPVVVEDVVTTEAEAKTTESYVSSSESATTEKSSTAIFEGPSSTQETIQESEVPKETLDNESSTTIESIKIEAEPEEQTSTSPIAPSDSSDVVSTDETKEITPQDVATMDVTPTMPSFSEKPEDSQVKQEASTEFSAPSTESASSSEASYVSSTEEEQHSVDSQAIDETSHGSHEEEAAHNEPDVDGGHKRPDEGIVESNSPSDFPPESGDITPSDPDDYDDTSIFGPGTCRYGGKIYMSAQQIPRDDPCDFCFCFRSDIICLQQSCPPPISACTEQPIPGFCCPRYSCPVSTGLAYNSTTTTTTTTTTVSPHFYTNTYKGSVNRGGCQVGNRTYRVGEDIRTKSGPCMSCICGGDGKMQCEPKACSASPMLKEMIAHAAARKRRR
ncbi:hypothetical protein TKK_0012534 [Trichogramma kaykai]|uniref:VWFC domain-containing protein n=1 Tax=Trichogramma kaykai TaxID=54128 RepID=A0ABD2WLJ6_9HYME